MSAVITRHKFSVAEYYRLYETGILDEHDRIELLDGDVNHLPATSSRHAITLEYLTSEILEQSRRRYVIGPQNPLELDSISVPQPDLVLVPYIPGKKGHNRAADVLLVVEISDSSLHYDREVKLPIYARAGIADYWIINLVEDTIEIYRKPKDNAYSDVPIHGLGATVSLTAFPDVTLEVSSLIATR